MRVWWHRAASRRRTCFCSTENLKLPQKRPVDAHSGEGVSTPAAAAAARRRGGSAARREQQRPNATSSTHGTATAPPRAWGPGVRRHKRRRPVHVPSGVLCGAMRAYCFSCSFLNSAIWCRHKVCWPSRQLSFDWILRVHYPIKPAPSAGVFLFPLPVPVLRALQCCVRRNTVSVPPQTVRCPHRND